MRREGLALILAAEAKTETHQKMMEEMARAWSEVAEDVETKVTQQS
jgi:BMFP domain-containing protein YqiC